MLKLCTHPACKATVNVERDESPRCPKHQHQKQIHEHQVDESGRYIYHTPAWRRLRMQKLVLSPMCEHCEMEGRAVAASMVDHIKEILDGGEAYDIDNLQSLCSRHHAIKSGKERKRRNGN